MLTAPTRAVVAIIFVSLFAVACATDTGPTDVQGEPYVDHAVASDFDQVEDTGKADGVGTSFDAANIMSDPFFNDMSAVDAFGMQSFLATSPYGNRSWLADERIGGRPFSDVLVDTAVEFGINPIVLLARMQVEMGLVSRTSRPSQTTIDRALGCGCFDGQSCRTQYQGFEKQLRCAANSLRNRYDDSVVGSGRWMAGLGNESLDGRWVVPANHATAALYAYTPWVLEGRGGTWLVWNVTRKYERHLYGMGLGGLDVYGNNTAPAYVEPFVGTPCTTNAECGFAGADGAAGFCLQLTNSDQGFCSLACEGLCPDRSGYATTFCVALPNSSIGVCAAKAESLNRQCMDVPDTLPTWATRFVGSSGAMERMAEVCLP